MPERVANTSSFSSSAYRFILRYSMKCVILKALGKPHVFKEYLRRRTVELHKLGKSFGAISKQLFIASKNCR